MKTIELKHDATAGELMAAMRPHVEEILKKYQDHIPGCASQSHRAIRAIEYLEARGVSGEIEDMNVRMEGLEDQATLERFVAVHKTVCLLEWVERNGSFNF